MKRGKEKCDEGRKNEERKRRERAKWEKEGGNKITEMERMIRTEERRLEIVRTKKKERKKDEKVGENGTEEEKK